MRTILAVGALALAAAAQVKEAKELPELREELARMKHELQRTASDAERLLELRIRHDLGLSAETTAHFSLGEAERALTTGVGERTLRDEEDKLATLGVRLQELEAKLAERKRRPADPPAEPVSGTPRPREDHKPVSGAVQEPPPAQPTDSRPKQKRPKPPPPGQPLLIQGSTDRRSVGRILFRAGRYRAAVEELSAAAAGADAEFVDLFYLAQSYEKLGEFAQADDLYKKIEARDTADLPTGKVPGPWALAARAAQKQMDWMSSHGQWKLPRSLESIDWRKNHDGGGR